MPSQRPAVKCLQFAADVTVTLLHIHPSVPETWRWEEKAAGAVHCYAGRLVSLPTIMSDPWPTSQIMQALTLALGQQDLSPNCGPGVTLGQSILFHLILLTFNWG